MKSLSLYSADIAQDRRCNEHTLYIMNILSYSSQICSEIDPILKMLKHRLLLCMLFRKIIVRLILS